MYTLKTTDKATIMVTQKQRDEIASMIQRGSKHVFVNDNLIMANAITGIYAEDAHDQQSGRLHDGTRVIKQFGQWVDANNPNIRLDHGHYPELARDDVMSEEQYKSNVAVLECGSVKQLSPDPTMDT
jgi:hypothetical protein